MMENTRIDTSDNIEAAIPLPAPASKEISPAKKKALLIFNCLLLSIGTCGGPLILRLYFVQGGTHVWLAAFVESCGWPFVVIALLIIYLRRPAATNNATTKYISIGPRLFSLAAFFGVLTGLDDYLYALGVSRLPISTFVLITTSELAFTAFFAYIIVKQKFTSYSINSVVLLTIGATLLSINSSLDLPKGEARQDYIMGFLSTLASAALRGLILPMVELTYYKTKQSLTYTLVLEIHTVMCLFATIFCTIGMFISSDFKVIQGEAADYGVDKSKYYAILFMNVVFWQCFLLGTIGVIFSASSLLSGIMMAVLLPVTEGLAVVCYREKFQPEKGVALALSLWGFVSYFYGEHKHLKKKRKNKESSDESTIELPS